MDQVDEIILATDSQLLIGMIRGFSKILVPYLSSRVGEVVENMEYCGAVIKFCKRVQNPGDIGSKCTNLSILNTSEYWSPACLQKPGLPDLVEIDQRTIPVEYIRPSLRLISQWTRIQSGFLKTILSFSKSFSSTINLVTNLLRMTYPFQEARGQTFCSGTWGD